MRRSCCLLQKDKFNTTEKIRENKKLLTRFQDKLRVDGFELEWPDQFYEK